MDHPSRVLHEERWHSASAEETIAVGQVLGSQLTPGNVVLLNAPMGAGKTTLVKGIVEGFSAGFAADVSSPTFTLMHEYCAQARVLHLDLYRLETEQQVRAIGVEDWLEELSEPGNSILLLVEWGERFPRLWPAKRYEIEILADDDQRTIFLRNLCPV